MQRPGQAAVYVLRDPTTRRVHYVGSTMNPSRRRHQHRELRSSKTSALHEWKSSLPTPPVFELVRWVPVESRFLEEQALIDEMRAAGEPILNTARATLQEAPEEIPVEVFTNRGALSLHEAIAYWLCDDPNGPKLGPTDAARAMGLKHRAEVMAPRARARAHLGVREYPTPRI